MFQLNYEHLQKDAAKQYKNRDFALFEAIKDENVLAIKGLIKYFGHRVNCEIAAGGHRGLSYADYPTPLSFALSREPLNFEIVKLLIELGANILDDYAIKYVRASQSKNILKLFNLPVNTNPIYVESVEANDLALLPTEKCVLGAKLVEAFHNKEDIKSIHDLVKQGAPVNYRLDYGLEVKLESDFVAAFFLLLEGDKGEKYLIDNATKLLGDEETAHHLANYVKTGSAIFDILHSRDANNEAIPLNPKFLALIKKNASLLRAQPEHKNGSLIIAAGLRDTQLLSQLILLGKVADKTLGNKLTNGANVNFKGYFNDNAAVWSAILLDKKALELLVDNGSDISELGITKSSLLHWAVVAARLDNTAERQSKALDVVKMLLEKGASLDEANALGQTPIDYARDELKEYLDTYVAPRYNSL
nr:ankyrin repeat domain-containing protein [Legionella pneumophila]